MANATELERYMLELINAERARAGLDPLKLEKRLNDAADGHSDWMLDTGTLSHTGAGGSTARERMEDAGFVFSGSWRSGENVAYQTERGDPGAKDDIARLHELLMDSSGHRANLLNPEFDYIGIGAEVRDGIVIVTQNFAKTSAPVTLDTGQGGGGNTGITAPEPQPVLPEPEPEAPQPQAVTPDRSGPDKITGTSGPDKITGTSVAEEIRARAGSDQIDAGGGDDTVYGGAGGDWIYASAGDDEIRGGRGFDTVDYLGASGGVRVDLKHEALNTGAAAGDVFVSIAALRGTHYDDDLRGNNWANRLRAAEGDDALQGRGGDDTLYGDKGVDTLEGGAGSDMLFGGWGADRFSFAPGDDRDVVRDFADDVDLLDFSAHRLSSVDAALARADARGGDVVFDFGGGDVVVVENVNLSQLSDDIMV
ncbi:Bifunctional hemolysin/adenylate cyclase precursor [Roseivivax jejudonensis]|uniref:Bifunctional hemolysin/adenylate cyclase n=1 Tax=Roseivivax jejudonensis TaxID=1529041 RepID=A0A1X6YX50_9RHOB|nr:CAP domain-containing protein [Roseivivax jejudonensis]SLN33342.1 Bifunctional hemolysin/adenylate cyclase precursor [Roseivivax jejudonensis]